MQLLLIHPYYIGVIVSEALSNKARKQRPCVDVTPTSGSLRRVSCAHAQCSQWFDLCFWWVRSFRTDKSTSILHPPSVWAQSCGFDRDIVRRRFCGVRQLYFLSSSYKSPLTSYFVFAEAAQNHSHFNMFTCAKFVSTPALVSEWVLVTVFVCV